VMSDKTKRNNATRRTYRFGAGVKVVHQ